MNTIWNEVRQKHANHTLQKHSDISKVVKEQINSLKQHKSGKTILRNNNQQIRSNYNGIHTLLDV